MDILIVWEISHLNNSIVLSVEWYLRYSHSEKKLLMIAQNHFHVFVNFTVQFSHLIPLIRDISTWILRNMMISSNFYRHRVVILRNINKTNRKGINSWWQIIMHKDVLQVLLKLIFYSTCWRAKYALNYRLTWYVNDLIISFFGGFWEGRCVMSCLERIKNIFFPVMTIFILN